MVEQRFRDVNILTEFKYCVETSTQGIDVNDA